MPFCFVCFLVWHVYCVCSYHNSRLAQMNEWELKADLTRVHVFSTIFWPFIVCINSALGAANVTIFGNNIQVNLEMVRYKPFDSQTKEAARVECPFSRVNTVWLHFIDMKNKRILFSFWFSIIQLWNNEMVWRLLFISLVYMESLDLFLSLITVNSFNFVLS